MENLEELNNNLIKQFDSLRIEIREISTRIKNIESRLENPDGEVLLHLEIGNREDFRLDDGMKQIDALVNEIINPSPQELIRPLSPKDFI